MLRKNQRGFMVFTVIFIIFGLWSKAAFAVDPTVKIIPEHLFHVPAGSDTIPLQALASGENLQYSWKLEGPGMFEGSTTHSKIFYTPPDTIDRKSVPAIITITVTNNEGVKATESIMFKIIKKESSGLSTGKKITMGIVGVGGGVVVGGIIALLAADDEDGESCSDEGLEFSQDWAYMHEPSYEGKVWIKITPKCTNRDAVHNYQIDWGIWVYTNQISFGAARSTSLWHTKNVDDATPLSFHIEPECHVTFGTGEPEEPSIEINEGWTQR